MTEKDFKMKRIIAEAIYFFVLRKTGHRPVFQTALSPLLGSQRMDDYKVICQIGNLTNMFTLINYCPHRRGDNAHIFSVRVSPDGLPPEYYFRPADERAMPGLSDRIIAPTYLRRIVALTI
jgi:hypothetical protein